MSPHAAPIHLPCTMRVVVRVFPAMGDVVVTFVRSPSDPLNVVSPSDSEWSDAQAECHFQAEFVRVLKVVTHPDCAATCCHAPESSDSLLRQAFMVPFASGSWTPRPRIASAIFSRCSGGILLSAANSGEGTSCPLGSNCDIRVSQSPGFAGGTGIGFCAASDAAQARLMPRTGI